LWNLLTAGPYGGHLDTHKPEMARGRLGICSAGWRNCWIQKLWWFWLGPVCPGVCSLITCWSL
jgi:hypothetical protein